jgi:hypothetical protein
MPEDAQTVTQMVLRSQQPSPNRHNCSGKHTGFLAYALLRDISSENYIDPAHPIQQTILQVFGEMCSLPVEQIAVGLTAARPRCLPYRSTTRRWPSPGWQTRVTCLPRVRLPAKKLPPP